MNKWNNKSGVGVKGTVVLALVMAISAGMLTACTGGNSNRQDVIDRIPSSQGSQKSEDVQKSTAGTTKTPGQTNIQGTEKKDAAATNADKGTAPEAEDKDIAGTEQKDIPSADTDNKTAGKENKDTAETENRETEAAISF